MHTQYIAHVLYSASICTCLCFILYGNTHRNQGPHKTQRSVGQRLRVFARSSGLIGLDQDCTQITTKLYSNENNNNDYYYDKNTVTIYGNENKNSNDNKKRQE